MTKMIMAKLETIIHSLHCIASNSRHQDTRINVLDTNNTVKCDFDLRVSAGLDECRRKGQDRA